MRYFKATDGNITVFCSSARVYLSASFRSGGQNPAHLISRLSFGANGKHPTEEITLEEYVALQDAQADRLKAAGRNMKMIGSQDYWVSNAALNA